MQSFIKSSVPLHLACITKRSETLIRRMIELFPEGLQAMNDESQYPLHLACEYKLSDSGLLLLLHGYPDAAHHKDSNGLIPSQYIQHIHSKIYRWLWNRFGNAAPV